jgi:hypothetical protein
VALVAFERVRPTLEDVFLQLVGREANGPDPVGGPGGFAGDSGGVAGDGGTIS